MGDVAVFGLLYDHIVRNLLDEAQISSYPALKAMYDGISSEPRVAAWIAAKNY